MWLVTPAGEDPWERLGALLIQRRTALDPRWHNRMAFADAIGLSYRTVYDIEEHRRTNFGGSTLAAIEAAYRLEPGAIGRFLEGGSLYPPEPRPDLALVPDAPPAVPAEVAADPAFERFYQAVEAAVGAAEVRENLAAARERRPVRPIPGSAIFNAENSELPERDANAWNGTEGGMDRDQRVRLIAQLRMMRARSDNELARRRRRALVPV